jgi:hypothetical protein
MLRGLRHGRCDAWASEDDHPSIASKFFENESFLKQARTNGLRFGGKINLLCQEPQTYYLEV